MGTYKRFILRLDDSGNERVIIASNKTKAAKQYLGKNASPDEVAALVAKLQLAEPGSGYNAASIAKDILENAKKYKWKKGLRFNEYCGIVNGYDVTVWIIPDNFNPRIVINNETIKAESAAQLRKAISAINNKVNVTNINNDDIFHSLRKEYRKDDWIIDGDSLCAIHGKNKIKIPLSRENVIYIDDKSYQPNINDLHILRTEINRIIDEKRNPHKWQKGVELYDPATSEPISKDLPVVNIELKGLLIKGNTFRCMNRSHKIENVQAIIPIIDSYGKMDNITATAGYCQQCQQFFIMDSTYERIKRRGVIMCLVFDQKTYNKQSSVNGMLLNQESTLKAHGYSVSEQEGLTELQRRKILAVLIDNYILSKTEIISLLDFFINMHQSDRFARSVDRWESDREFVENYWPGEMKKFGVKGIYRF